jgi:hypothetical protein
LDGDIDIKVFDVQCEEPVVGVNTKFYQFMGQTVGTGGVVQVT